MKNVARLTAIGALFVIPFLPLYVANELFFPFITGKGFAFRILVEIAVVAWGVLMLFDARYRPRFSPVIAIFSVFVVWMAFADALGVHQIKAFWSNFERMDGWITLVHVFGFFLVSASVLSVGKLWRKWWLVFLSASALVCGLALLQFLGAYEIHQGGARIDATFGNAAYLAVYLLFATFVAFWQAGISRGWLKYALYALAALEAVLVFQTQTRGAMLGLIAGIVIAALLYAVTAGERGKTIAVTVVVALTLLAGGFFLVRDTAWVKGDPVLSRLASISIAELGTRLTIWNMARQGVMEDPITGWGQEGFNQVFNKYYDPSLYKQEAWFDRAHNTFIDWLVAGGIPAFLLFLALLLSAPVLLFRSAAPLQERILLSAGLGAYAVQALVVFDNLFSYVPLVAILAVIHSHIARPVKRFDELPVLPASRDAFVGSVAIIGAILIIWAVNISSIRAAHHLVYAVSPLPQGAPQNLSYFEQALKDGSSITQETREQFVNFASASAQRADLSDELRATILSRALEEMEREIDIAPNDARLRLQLAQAYESAGDVDGALEQLRVAETLSPRKQAILMRTGMFLIDHERPAEGLEMLERAYRLDTSFEDVAAMFAAGTILSGDVAAGKEILTEAFGTTTPDNDTVFYAYYQAKRFDDLIAVAKVRVAATAGNPKARYRLAQAYAAAGRFDAARTEITLTVANHPETRAEGEALMKRIFVPAR